MIKFNKRIKEYGPIKYKLIENPNDACHGGGKEF